MSTFTYSFIFATVGLEAWARESQIGLKIGSLTWKLEMFADDLTAFVGSLDDIQLWIIALAEWRDITGLGIAKEKCGLWRPNLRSDSFISVEVERVLGVFLCSSDQQSIVTRKELL